MLGCGMKPNYAIRVDFFFCKSLISLIYLKVEIAHLQESYESIIIKCMWFFLVLCFVF